MTRSLAYAHFPVSGIKLQHPTPEDYEREIHLLLRAGRYELAARFDETLRRIRWQREFQTRKGERYG